MTEIIDNSKEGVPGLDAEVIKMRFQTGNIDSVHEKIDRPKSVIVSSILHKVEQEIRSLRIMMAIAHDATELARLGMDAIPFARTFAKARYQSVVTKFEKATESKYEYDPNKLFITILEVLEAEGKFDEDELAYLRENKSILLRMFKSKIDEKLLTEEPLDEMPKRVQWDNMHPKELLNTNLFTLLELPEEEFRRIYRSPRRYKNEKAKTQAQMTEFSVKKKGVTATMFKRDVMEHEEKLCKMSNDIWRRQTELYFDKQEDVDASLFSGRIAETNDHFDLYQILGEFEALYYEYQTAVTRDEKRKIIEKVEELDMARRKLLIYLSASNLTQNPQYKYRESVKQHLDDHLSQNIFQITGRTVVSPEGYPDIQKEVLTAQITDPVTGESVQVYLYEGLNSDKPEGGTSGIVNIKALYKVVMKDLLLDKEEVRDFFRITVMPVNPKELGKMREVLASTGLINPQSLTKETIYERTHGKDNKATAYKDKDLVNYDAIVSPYVKSNNRLRRGRIRDSHKKYRGDIVNIGPINLEVRTGTVDDLVPEDTAISHKAYSKMRMEPAWRRLYSPDHYWRNSVSLMYLKQNQIKASLRDPNNRTLPGFITMSYLNARKEAANGNVCVGDVIKREIRKSIGRVLIA